MKIIVGLGNPGPDYQKTRHNTGFMALEAFAQENGVEFNDKPKFFAHIAEMDVKGEKVILVKPQTFYNEAGRSYRAIVDFYKVDPTDTLIVHDELALPFGTIRIREGGSDAGNNGIKSINQYGGEASMRLRVGISNESRAIIGDTDFVLSRFGTDESNVLIETLFPRLHTLIEDFVAGDLTITSHRNN